MVAAKICGINDPIALATACEAGAAYLGFNFYPPSPRALTPAEAAELTVRVPTGICKVGLFVDPTDRELDAALRVNEFDLIQLHGSESIERCKEIKDHFAIEIMKVIKIASREDLDTGHDYEAAVDLLLFDTKAPKEMKDALPGGNGLTFDWNLLRNRNWPVPWMLAGGLHSSNVAEAVNLSGAAIVDVSSGVENQPGDKDPAKIKAFLDALKGL